MPILVDYTPAGAAVQLGANAGQFAAGMQQSADDRAWQGEADHRQIAEAGQALQAAQMQQAARFHEEQLRQMESWHNGELSNQQAAIGQRAAAVQTNAGVRREGIQTQSTDRNRGYDVREEHNAAQEGHWNQQDDNQQQRTEETGRHHTADEQLAAQRIQLLHDRIANTLSGGDKTWAQQHRMEIDQAVRNDRDLDERRTALQTLMARENSLRKVLDPANPELRKMDPAQRDGFANELKTNRDMQTRIFGDYQNKIIERITTPRQPLTPPPGARGNPTTMPAAAGAPAGAPAAPMMPGDQLIGTDADGSPLYRRNAAAAPQQPAQPAQPVQPVQPAQPVQPVAPMPTTAPSPRVPTAFNRATGQRMRLDPATNQWVPIQ